MIHGQEFKDLLDPRDVVLEHKFDLQCDIVTDDLAVNKFFKSRSFDKIQEKIKHFLVDAVGNILSISFRYLSERKM